MVEPRKKIIGILGGSFDPVHKGHVKISKITIKKITIDKLYWVITKKNPFKKQTFFSLKKRIEYAKRAVASLKKIQVLYLDDVVKSSRTIDIIKYLIKKRKPSEIYFIVGSDVLAKFHKWKSWKKIVKLTKLIVFYRYGYDKRISNFTVFKYLKKNKIVLINNRPIKVSSTSIRNKISKIK